MRGKRVKALRRASRSKKLLSNDQAVRLHSKGWVGKGMVTMLYVDELTKPSGTWREYWSKRLQRISQANRLPRGFKQPKPLFCID